MKPTEQKQQFIIKRAEGKSYSTIARELGISKATCTEWERELKARIAEKRAEQLEALYTTYYMTKEARIKRIGESLAQIDEALEKADLTTASPEKLLELKLKYGEALQGEYIPLGEGERLPAEATPKDIYIALVELANRIIAGEISQEQAQREQNILTTLLKAYESVETQKRLEQLEALVGGKRA